MAENASPRDFFQGNLAELAPADAFDPVMLGQSLVQKGAAAVKQFQGAAVAAQKIEEHELGLPQHVTPQVFVERRVTFNVGRGPGQIAKPQPLGGEVIKQ